MTTITFEVPDELASELDALHDQLPASLYEVLKSRPADKTKSRLKSVASHPAYRDIFDFLATDPTPEQIISHRPAVALQERVAELLEKNREYGLNAEDEVELDGYEQVDDLMSLLKIRARMLAS